MANTTGQLNSSIFWHALSGSEVLSSLRTSKETGLTNNEVLDRRSLYGANELPVGKKFSWFRLLAHQFVSPLIYILLVAAALTFWLQEYGDTAVILMVVVLNAAIGFYQEHRSEKTLVSLRRIVRVSALVWREGMLREIDARDLVPGDFVHLKAGAMIPADSRIIQTRDLETNEAILTGESTLVKKNTDPVSQKTPLADQSNMVWMGTVVERGSGQVVVVATGANTELGRIATLTALADNHLTPLQIRLRHLANRISIAVVAVGIIIISVGAFGGLGFFASFETAVAVAVAAIPEGLVAALSVVLAVSTTRILKQKGLVRQPIAAETLGSTTVICADKTGTLTEGVMKVEQAFLEGDHETALLALALANEAVSEKDGDSFVFRGGATDRAKLEFVLKENADLVQNRVRFSEVAFLPFTSHTKYIAAFVNDKEKPDALHCLVTGAPELLLTSSKFLGNAAVLKEEDRKNLLVLQERLASEGYRLIGIADRVLPRNTPVNHVTKLRALVSELHFRGIVALRDPIRSDVKETLAVTRKAGIRVLMITGDHLLTATAIGRELGFSTTTEESVVTGAFLDTLSDEQLRRVVHDVAIYCRVTAEHKLRIVRALMANGESVAMTGDGINDAPALRAADIGVATVSATDATKEAADLVLLNNGLSTITAAVKEGRITFDNIRKVTLFLLSASFTELILILGTLLLGLPLPLTPVMILWANMIQDGLPTFSLAFEPGEPNVMQRAPVGRTAPILTAQGQIIVFGTAIVRDLLLLAGFGYFAQRLGVDIPYARTIMFAIIAINPLLYIFSLRSLDRPIWVTGINGNRFLLFTTAGSLLIALATIYMPFFNYLLGTVPLVPSHLLFIVGVAVFDITTIEIVKRFTRTWSVTESPRYATA
ncbi:MAG: HAD-IC family P-type ATPase [Patescibacteria group bacterium]|jgi:Ca2+-transporting ATPase